ncbi:hypothetical protein [Methylocapsa sp. S129]|uniref:hypothetical protein n=1 Tax=Methylocapsa sp. S129 TaxID=1641869 RepID=UPI001FF0797E|nr:hypothetical protein [Methylocapsa sp. S129]
MTDEQSERFGIAGALERARIDGIEAGVANERSGDRFARLFVAAVDEARPRQLPLEDIEQHFAGHGVEGGDDSGARSLLGEFLGARGGASDDKFGIARVERQAASHNDFAG